MNCPYNGKVCLDRNAAQRTAAYWRHRGERMEYYQCAACNSWHVGHPNIRMRRAPRRAARR